MAWYAKFEGVDGSSGDRFIFQPQLTTETTAPEPYMEFRLKEVLISGVIQNGDSDGFLAEDHVGPLDVSVDPSDPSGGVFPTETVRPMESLHDLAV